MKPNPLLNRLLGLGVATILVSSSALAQEKVDFAKQIQPILKESCVKCHGTEKKKGKLRLDNKADALKGGDTGPAWVAGNSAKSLLIERLETKNEDDRMPQKADPLPADKIKLFKAWIDQGAVWPD